MAIPSNAAVVTSLGNEIWLATISNQTWTITTGNLTATGKAITLNNAGVSLTIASGAVQAAGSGVTALNVYPVATGSIRASGHPPVPIIYNISLTVQTGSAVLNGQPPNFTIDFKPTAHEKITFVGLDGISIKRRPYVPPTPALPTWTQDDFTAAQSDLLPQGRAWPKYPGSNLMQTMTALVGSYVRDQSSPFGDTCSAYGSTVRAMQILRDTMPWWNQFGAGATSELLDEWNATLGLPDPCLPDDASLDQQIRTAVAKFVATGGQSIQYIEDFCEALGYSNVEVTEYAPFRADLSSADSALADEQSWFFWSVGTPNTGAWLFEADINVGGDPLGGVGNNQLACELSRIAPAHTYFNVVYT